MSHLIAVHLHPFMGSLTFILLLRIKTMDQGFYLLPCYQIYDPLKSNIIEIGFKS